MRCRCTEAQKEGAGGGGSGFSGWRLWRRRRQRRQRSGRGCGHYGPAQKRPLRGAGGRGEGGRGGRSGEVLRHEPEGPLPGFQPEVRRRRLGFRKAQRVDAAAGGQAPAPPGACPCLPAGERDSLDKHSVSVQARFLLPRLVPSVLWSAAPPRNSRPGSPPGPQGTRFFLACPPSLLSQLPPLHSSFLHPATCHPFPALGPSCTHTPNPHSSSFLHVFSAFEVFIGGKPIPPLFASLSD